eukprot:520212-Pyramimonas_sp.AAC.1
MGDEEEVYVEERMRSMGMVGRALSHSRDTARGIGPIPRAVSLSPPSLPPRHLPPPRLSVSSP